MKIKYEATFRRDLEEIRDPNLLKRVGRVIEDARKAQSSRDVRKIKKLKGHDTYYRIKLGDYRLGIEMVGDEIIFVRFLHRREVYRFFP